MWNDSAEFDPVTAELLEEKIWGDEDFVSDLVLVAAREDDTVGFIVGVIRPSGIAYVKLMAVDVSWRRQGIGSKLLRTLEILVRLRGASAVRVFESAPNYLVPGIDQQYPSARAFVESAGYEHIGQTSNLTVDLRHAAAGPDTGVVGPDTGVVNIRRVSNGDREHLVAMLEANWPEWIPEVEVALGNAPPSIYVASRGEEVVGFAAYDANNHNTGWFGPMGVVEAERGSGLGCQLLRRCLADIRDQGHDKATIPWVGPVAFYERCVGAVVSRTFDRFEKSFSSSAG